MMSLLGFIVALSVLVTVHEWGHYRVAVACGIRVERFSIGFGPPLLRWCRRQNGLDTEIEFVIASIPLGGYVKLLDTRESEVSVVAQGTAFDHQPLRARVAVVLAGPMANFGLAALLYAVVFVVGSWQVVPSLSVPVTGSAAERAGLRGGEIVRAVGTESDDLHEVTSLDDLRWWLMLQPPEQAVYLSVSLGVSDPSNRAVRELRLEPMVQANDDALSLSLEALGVSAPQTPAVLRELVPNGAAERSGLQRGDRVHSIDEHPIMDAHQLKQVVRESGAHGAPEAHIWRVERSGALLDVPVVLDVVSEDGHSIGRIGAMLGQSPEKVWVAFGPLEALDKALERTAEVTVLTFKTLGGMLTGSAAWQNLGGPIAIAEGAGQSMQIGWDAFVTYLALLSVSLGVFNLLPIPALDGGHLLYYLYEFLSGKTPAQRWVLLFQQVGFFALMVLMVVALLNDLHRLGG